MIDGESYYEYSRRTNKNNDNKFRDDTFNNQIEKNKNSWFRWYSYREADDYIRNNLWRNSLKVNIKYWNGGEWLFCNYK